MTSRRDTQAARDRRKLSSFREFGSASSNLFKDAIIACGPILR